MIKKEDLDLDIEALFESCRFQKILLKYKGYSFVPVEVTIDHVEPNHISLLIRAERMKDMYP